MLRNPPLPTVENPAKPAKSNSMAAHLRLPRRRVALFCCRSGILGIGVAPTPDSKKFRCGIQVSGCFMLAGNRPGKWRSPFHIACGRALVNL